MRCCYYKWFAFDVSDKSSSAAQLATDVYFYGGPANLSRDLTCQFSRECGEACQQGADNYEEAERHGESAIHNLQIIATLGNSDANGKAGIWFWFGQDYRASEDFTVLELVVLTFIKLGVRLHNFKPQTTFGSDLFPQFVSDASHRETSIDFASYAVLKFTICIPMQIGIDTHRAEVIMAPEPGSKRFAEGALFFVVIKSIRIKKSCDLRREPAGKRGEGKGSSIASRGSYHLRRLA
jgi:hypothetical protein